MVIMTLRVLDCGLMVAQDNYYLLTHNHKMK